MTTRKLPTVQEVLNDLKATVMRLENFDNRLLSGLVEMREVLEAIADYWQDYETNQAPLHPGAMLTDDDECIAERVRTIVRKVKAVEDNR